MSKFSQNPKWKNWFRDRETLNPNSSFNGLDPYEMKYLQWGSTSDSKSSINDVSSEDSSAPIITIFRILALLVFIALIAVFILYLTPNVSANMNIKYASRSTERDHQKVPDSFYSTYSKPDSFESENENSFSSSEDSDNINSEIPEEVAIETADVNLPANPFGIPQVMYLHIDETDTTSDFYWVPKILEQRVSKDDISIDLSNFMDSSLAYELSDYERKLVDLVVHRESNGEPFLGQVLVAEDILNRFRSGLYGPDKIAILVNWYEAKIDSDGSFHVYNGSTEILEASESVQKAVDLALSGSNISYFLLKAVTDLRNEQYDIDFGDIYYRNGAMYHFSPKYIDEGAAKTRTFNRIPVSFWYEGHIFYGYWLPKSQALQIF